MAFRYSPKIVTDGLVFAVDAANKKSYTSGSSTWSDLAGSNDGTLTNGPTFDSGNGGYIDFDGANDYVSIGYTQPAQNSTTSFTWSIWIYLDSSGNGNNTIFGNRYSSNPGTQFIKITPTKWEYYNSGGQFIDYNIPLSQWVNLCVIKDQGTHYYYSNGSQVGTRSATLSIAAMPVFMGADGYSGVQEAANVNFATAMIYEKALSAAEVTQNYNALKSRFGL